MAGMDDGDLGYLADRCRLYAPWQQHESIDRGSGHHGPRVLVRYKGVDLTRWE